MYEFLQHQKSPRKKPEKKNVFNYPRKNKNKKQQKKNPQTLGLRLKFHRKRNEGTIKQQNPEQTKASRPQKIFTDKRQRCVHRHLNRNIPTVAYEPGQVEHR